MRRWLRRGKGSLRGNGISSLWPHPAGSFVKSRATNLSLRKTRATSPGRRDSILSFLGHNKVSGIKMPPVKKLWGIWRWTNPQESWWNMYAAKRKKVPFAKMLGLQWLKYWHLHLLSVPVFLGWRHRDAPSLVSQVTQKSRTDFSSHTLRKLSLYLGSHPNMEVISW